MSFKVLAKSLLHRCGLDLVRIEPEIHRPFAILPLLVRELIATDGSFFFVQVGANDGVLDDPLCDLIRQHGLPGLLIEPLFDIFETLKHNYRDQPQLLFENVAILDCDKTLELHCVRKDARPLRHHWHGLASMNRNNLINQGVPTECIESTLVRGTTLKSLLDKHAIANVSLLQVDTEGYDYDVIKSAFNAGIYPTLINYEHCWLVPHIRNQCKEMLDRNGYQFVEAGKDTLALRHAV